MADPSVVLQDGQEGVSYGPAMARRTRTPINFSRNEDPGLSGNTDPGNHLQFLASLAPMMKRFAPTGTINVYPNSDENKVPGGLSDTIRHEEVHALMHGSDVIGRLFGSDFSKIAPNDKEINNLAPYIKNRTGDPKLEIPAYATQKGVYPEDQRQAFIQAFSQRLAASNPRAAQIYQLLTQGQ
jgi:hypothetical protein